jgi:Na+:H+ antiporter, NhaA family
MCPLPRLESEQQSGAILGYLFIAATLKQEILVGELSEPQQSIPVIAAALGGMPVRAVIFITLNANSASVHGWAVQDCVDLD